MDEKQGVGILKYLSALVSSAGGFNRIEKLPDSQRKEKLEEWITNDLLNRFENRIIDFTVEISQTWGRIQGQAELNGKTISLIDGFIAASAISDGMVIVTRNVKNFNQSGVSLLNPWEQI